MFLSLVIEVLCPDLSDLLNVSLNSTLRSVSTVLEAVCANDTLRFTDGAQRKVLTCLNTGEWDYLLTNCESMYSLFLTLYIYIYIYFLLPDY